MGVNGDDGGADIKDPAEWPTDYTAPVFDYGENGDGNGGGEDYGGGDYYPSGTGSGGGQGAGPTPGGFRWC